MNKIVFFGTSTFSANVLEHLIHSNASICSVVTQPDKPIKRSKVPSPPPVKVFALENCPDILIFQPEKASNKAFVEEIKKISPDLFVVVAYGQILKKNLLDIPKIAPINIHASLLPKYRGAAPIHRAIMNGEQKTGITIMKMNEKMDAGEVILKEDCSIEIDDTFSDVENKLLKLACSLISQVLDDCEKNICLSSPQNHDMATFAPKIDQKECQINWDDDARNIHNKIRALSLKPKAWSFVKIEEKFTRVKIISSKIVDSSGASGEVIQKKPLIVGCKNKAILIKKIQPEGKKIMDSKNWINGLNKKKFIFT